MLSIQHYEILQSIHQEGQMTKVAKRLGLSQPTITFHLKKMEEKCGFPLVEYHGRRTILSSTGKLLLPYAERILQVQKQTEQTIQDVQHLRQGALTIGASNTVASYMIPETLPKMFAQFPEMDCTIQVHNARTIRQLVQQYELDFGLIVAHEQDLEDLAAIPIREDPIGIVLNASHPLADYPFHDPSVLVNERFLLREKDSQSTKTFHQWCQKAGIICRFEVEIQSAEAIKKGVLSNIGIAVVSKMSVEEEVKKGQLLFREIASERRRSMFLIYHAKRRLSPLHQAMIDLILQTWREQDGSLAH
ncbi:LysR family transcriptional regulator [Aureibacillus halotolerans]|uniref:LysR family transcriptional regulator n=1 Tax=Aureibacillus halotolerans TaxID=1508390 RepID=A0A4R6TRL6_9BACI|nr:LysR family transcriptional regulator [Aureibacillus halotolerans]TDQ36218.1 LysR family transcriptional regulator [Aureibacillus halotolerans]